MQSSVEDILSNLRLSLYDSHQFALYAPRLMELAPELVQEAHLAVAEAIDSPGHTSVVASVAFSPDGKTLASGSADQTIILWHLAGQRQL